MASRPDIEQPLTLEFAGDIVPPADFERLIAAFFDTIGGLEVPGKQAAWSVEVKQGSQLIGLRPVGMDAKVISAFTRHFEKGVRELEAGALVTPPHLSEKALRGLRTIARFADSEVQPRIWVGFKVTELTQRTVASVSDLLEGSILEVGSSVQGRLQTVSERDGFRFVLYDRLGDYPIKCHVREEDRGRVMAAFGMRVEVYGTVRYRKDGRATAVTVDDFMVFPDSNDLPKAHDVEGILRNYHRG